ncbi:hypothetical protein VCR9J2_720048 [Vibrio crassostreae]|nr:hypothetical protein VCR9J2_720048 [Vibrio crassostreae]
MPVFLLISVLMIWTIKDHKNMGARTPIFINDLNHHKLYNTFVS